MNAFMVTAMAISGIWFTDNVEIKLWHYLLTAVVAITYIGIAMVHNDIIDVEIDKINAPLRPIPAGYISIKQAKVYVLALFIIGTCAGIFLHFEAIIIMLITLILSLIYNAYLKKTGFLGNIIVGITATSAFLYGDAVGSGFKHFWPPNHWNASIYLFLISSLLNTSREVAKGIMDVMGDKQHDVNTIAVRFGKQTASFLVLGILLIASLFAIIPIINHTFGYVYIIALFIFLFLMVQVVIPLIKNPVYDTANLYKKRIILIMLLALIIIIIDVAITRYFY